MDLAARAIVILVEAVALLAAVMIVAVVVPHLTVNRTPVTVFLHPVAAVVVAVVVQNKFHFN